MDHNYIEKLKNFADALASDKFTSNEEIKQEMDSLGLIYCDDEIERLNHVLLALHPLSEKIKAEQNESTQKELSH